MISTIAGWPVVIDPSPVLLAVTFAVSVRGFSGFYPARKAARMNPIAALRFE
jgi:ABC-type antimicrobial peptide transport system permease subunit